MWIKPYPQAAPDWGRSEHPRPQQSASEVIHAGLRRLEEQETQQSVHRCEQVVSRQR
ncbi:type II toxin-antitoxin system ParD family antitoxin [Arthrobacter castelli]|uniref:type II toxin-antitoxin system ParD family antitoxin n=1 Tax=Arthrobacter castelli TaxID=271431 RepID=UPI0012DE1969